MFFEENGIENVGCGTDLAEVFIIVVDLILNWRGGGEESRCQNIWWNWGDEEKVAKYNSGANKIAQNPYIR